MLSRRRPLYLLVTGLLLVAVGGAVLVLVPTHEFGWFAYAPLSETITPGVVLATAHMWGAAVGAVGLVVSSWAAGYVAGRRAERRP